MIMEIVSILLGVLILLITENGVLQGGLRYTAGVLFDPASLIIILVFTVPVLIRNGVWNDFKRAFLLIKKEYSCHLSELKRTQDVLEMLQRQVFCAGIVATMLTFINILHSLTELAALGPKVATAVLTVLYAAVIEMLLLPLQFEVKRRIIDYMELDAEPEETQKSGEKNGDAQA